MVLSRKLCFISGDHECEVRTIHENDVNNAYVNGLRNQKKYLKNIPKKINKSSQKEYVARMVLSKQDTLLGLFIDGGLVASAGIQLSLSDLFLAKTVADLNEIATVGVFIYDNTFRGEGLGKSLVWASTYLFNECTQIKWFGAGMEKENIPSLQSFISCGYLIDSQDDVYYRVILNVSDIIMPTQIINHRIREYEIKSEKS